MRDLLTERTREVIIVLAMLCGPIAYLNVQDIWWGHSFYGLLLPFGRLEFYNGFRLFYSGEQTLILCSEIRLWTTLLLIIILNHHRKNMLNSKNALLAVVCLMIIQIFVPLSLISWRYGSLYGYFIPLPTQAILALVIVLFKRRSGVEVNSAN